MARESRWLADLVAIDEPIGLAAAMDGTAEDWATGSLEAARLAYREPAKGRRVETGDVLGEAYYYASLPIVRRQTYRAGARLAWVLSDDLRPE